MKESEIQRAVFAEIAARGKPGVVAWHHPNDKSARRKTGYLAGMPDVCILHLGKFYGIELKRDGGRASQDQLETIAAINLAQGFAWVAEGLPQTIKALEVCGILRKAAA